MQILYIWFKKYKALNEFQTNFGSKYNFFYDGKDTLYVKDNEIFISDFFKNSLANKEISNFDISAIVGENGSGKSTILDFLVQITLDENLNDYIIIYSHNRKLYRDYRLSNKFQIVYQTKKEINIETRNFYDSSYLTMFFSNVFDVRYLNNNYSKDTDEFVNISTNALLSRHENANDFMYEELQRQIFFVNKYKKKFDINQIIELPSKIKIEIMDYEYNVITLRKYINDDDIKNKDIKLLNFNNFKKSKMFKEEFRLDFINSYLDEIENILIENSISISYEDLRDMYLEALNKCVGENDFMNIIYNTLNIKANKLFLNVGFLKEVKELSDKYLKFYKLFTEIRFSLRTLNDIDLNTGEDIIYEYIEIDSTLAKSKEFIDYYINNFLKTDLLKFSWLELSSGQFSFLTLFSRFAYAVENLLNTKKYTSYLLLIDEGDLYFHPQLQKDWLYYFIKIVDAIFKGNIQVILTTHSPFVLSDIPNTNVTFLNKAARKNYGATDEMEGSPRTFAANISELLSNSFFIKDGLIGEFAKERINSCIRWILETSPKEVYKERDSLIKFIDLIGEPILRNKVYDIYKNKLKLFEAHELLEIMEIIESKLKNIKNIVDEDKNKND